MFSKDSIFRFFIYLFSGSIFGFGLAISEMNNTQVVKAFLDITGEWNYSLMFVMGSAVLITGIGYKLIFLRKKPILDEAFKLPKHNGIDKPLIIGAIVFGLGWGLYGFCPGPALASLASLSPYSLAFVVAMVVGMQIAKRVKLS